MARSKKVVASSPTLAKRRPPSADEYLRRVEVVPISSLRPHPRNYRAHPESQLAHVEASLGDYGYYKNVLVARDGTILAGHGVVLAATASGAESVPVVRLDLLPDEPRALKVLALDNELGRFAEDDDRALTEILRDLSRDESVGLFGTGYDERQLAALLMVTRPANEIADQSAAGEWVGMPEYHDADGERFQLVVTFESEKDRKRFVSEKSIKVVKTVGSTWSARWPAVENEDASSVRFEARGSKRPSAPAPKKAAKRQKRKAAA